MSAMNMSAIEKMSGAAFEDAPLPLVFQRSVDMVVAGEADRRDDEVADTERRLTSRELSTESDVDAAWTLRTSA